MNPFGIAGAALGGIADIGKLIFGLHQNHLANQIHPFFQQYVTSPYAKDQLGDALNAYNGRIAGAADLANNIYAAGANNYANTARNATDSGQALALGMLNQGQQNDAFTNLGIQEAQNKYQLLNNLNSAYGVMRDEGDKVYQSMLQKYMMDTQQQQQLRNSASQNIFGAASDLSGGAIQFGNYLDTQNNETPRLWDKIGYQ